MSDFQEIRDILKENAIQLQKLEQLQAINEINSEKEYKELRESQEKLTKNIDRLEIQTEKTSKEIDKISKFFNGFTRNQGSMIKNFFKEHKNYTIKGFLASLQKFNLHFK